MAADANPFESAIFKYNQKVVTNKLIINMHGHPGAGKTFAALTASKNWPEDLQAQMASKKEVVLEDVVYIGWDDSGLVGLAQYNIRPAYALDMRVFALETGDLLKATDKMLKALEELYKKNTNLRIAIHDTITRMDSLAETYFFLPENSMFDFNGNPDSWGNYRCLARFHHDYQMAATTAPKYLSTIFIFHQKVLEEKSQGKQSQQKAAEEKQLIMKMGDRSVHIIPAMTGKSINLYTADASLELVCVKKGSKRLLYPTVYEGQRAKNRFEGVLTGPVEAHMGKVLELLRKECGE